MTWQSSLARGGLSVTQAASGMALAALLIAFLFFGRAILEPLVIAALLAFILSPVIRRLRRLGLWRVPAVVVTVAGALGVLAALSATIVVQIAQLAEELPRYETNLRTKLRSIGGGTLTSGIIEGASGTLKKLEEEISSRDPEKAGQRPLPVEIREPQPTGLSALANLVRPLLSPLATTALVILFLLFILLQREDLRDRFLRLAGTADLQRSTAALDDAGSRLSRFFLMQTLLNGGFGIVIAVGLWLIGVPSPVLWGILAGLMRFVPFVGAFIAAFFPIALAAAVDPGWSMVAMTVALFAISEPLVGHVVEPVLYSQHAGLSPVAIVVSSLFWTMLWGPIGLLLATPLTLCLVVLSRHVDALGFIAVVLGDEPALEPEQRFYQRVLAEDATEAADLAEQHLKTEPLASFYDRVPMRALMLAQVDAVRGRLTREEQQAICSTMHEVIDEVEESLQEASNASEALPAAVSKGKLPDTWQMPYPVLCIGSRSHLDQAACFMLAHLLRQRGINAWVQPFVDVARASNFKTDIQDAPVVCLSYFGAASRPAHVRYMARRIKRLMPGVTIVAGFWMLREDKDTLPEWAKSAGVDAAATSLEDVVSIVVGTAQIHAESAHRGIQSEVRPFDGTVSLASSAELFQDGADPAE